uniref:Transmembrane protein 65 n=1 Tax=Globodera pallida TaxID=36090 RepID=A0A183CHE0_GLOPA
MQWRRLWTTTDRLSSSDVYKHDHFLHLDHLRIGDLRTARLVADHLRPSERKLLLQALAEHNGDKKGTEESNPAEDQPSLDQAKQLFFVNTIPFIGFGVLDNMIMILAGEYIDQYLGILLCISTMAAAALGNILSDLAGVGLAHYVEQFVSHLGFKQPVLTPAQLESKKARLTVNAARAFGLTVGCLIGMFPLLFFDSPECTKEGRRSRPTVNASTQSN